MANRSNFGAILEDLTQHRPYQILDESEAFDSGEVNIPFFDTWWPETGDRCCDITVRYNDNHYKILDKLYSCLYSLVFYRSCISILVYCLDTNSEQLIEEHQFVFDTAYEHTLMKRKNQRFYWRCDMERNEFFVNPTGYFTECLYRRVEFIDPEAPYYDENICVTKVITTVPSPDLAWVSATNMAERGDLSIVLGDFVAVHRTEGALKTKKWVHRYLLLRNSRLYLFMTEKDMYTYALMSKARFVSTVATSPSNIKLFVDLHDWNIVVFQKDIPNCPTDYKYGVGFRPRVLLPSPNSKDSAIVLPEGARYDDFPTFGLPTFAKRTRWLTAMRLEKFGDQLRDNYKTHKLWISRSRKKYPFLFKKETNFMEMEFSSSPKDDLPTLRDLRNIRLPRKEDGDFMQMEFPSTSTKGFITLNDLRNIRFPRKAEDPDMMMMDFSKPRPRQEEEDLSISQNFRGVGLIPEFRNMVRRCSYHKWFHGKISRKTAETLIENQDVGTYIVRISDSNEGMFVLTNKDESKVRHSKIALCRHSRFSMAYALSLDGKGPYFFSIPKLLEFYSLNLRHLPNLLDKYIPKSLDDSGPSTSDELSPERTPLRSSSPVPIYKSPSKGLFSGIVQSFRKINQSKK